MQQTFPSLQLAAELHWSDTLSLGLSPASAEAQLLPFTHANTGALPVVSAQQVCPGMEQDALPHGKLVVLPPGPNDVPPSFPAPAPPAVPAAPPAPVSVSPPSESAGAPPLPPVPVL